MSKPVCAVVGIGPKNGAAFAKRFHASGFAIALISRTTEFSTSLAKELGEGAKVFACDVSNPDAVHETFTRVRSQLGDPEILIYNAGSGSWKGFDETSVEDLTRSFAVNALGMMVSAQEVLPAMRKARRGSIIIVGATASLRGKPKTTAFAAAKAAQRSLAQSMARQFWPEGIHVSLMIIDGGIGEADAEVSSAVVDKLDPTAIADAALSLTRQPPSAWSFEVDQQLQVLIRRMPKENGWRARRIHAEFEKLGFDVSISTVTRYLPPAGRGDGEGQP